MAYCPSCAALVASDATRCENCNALFGEGSTWKPLDRPPAIEPPGLGWRIAAIAFTACIALLGLAALALGGLMAASENNSRAAWLMGLAALALAGIAAFARLRWTLLAVIIAVPAGLATCVGNFKWHGG